MHTAPTRLTPAAAVDCRRHLQSARQSTEKVEANYSMSMKVEGEPVASR